MKTYILYSSFQLVEDRLAKLNADAVDLELQGFAPEGHEIEILSADEWNKRKINLLNGTPKPHGIVFNSMAFMDDARTISREHPDIRLVVHSGEQIQEPGIKSILKATPNEMQRIADHLWPT